VDTLSTFLTGCDSIVTTNLTVLPPINTNVTAMYPTCGCPGKLIADDTGATSYQWINCNTGNIISGQTNQEFYILSTGDYAVIITEGSCIDTSACTYGIATGINKLSEEVTALSAFPNPASDHLTLSFNITKGTTLSYYLTNVFGQVFTGSQISSFNSGENTITINLQNIPDGFYFVKISNGKQEITERFVKSSR
jgi:hypothetical protein